ncbi:GTP 3',8-cyclase MoaA [Dechloromonas hortensis]|uniref:GTP 3',8-cyclase MoaA n=1 Tax=Dechloromonas hortensis TaxID=337779 RepID=UPI000CAE996D|nr:GTP 3',8-cyclase MoaA [Dechloromonas hortensis]PKO89330.1 MAG: GTP 3',8-cyclase MoaA [Betaproteobacteria bacterium HGW-Betaproteobacteria-12]
MLIDGCGRQIDYLRLSVTDRCDLRCAYCMPPEFDDFEISDQWMNFNEIVRICRIFIDLGVSRVRLTGGEPLVRARIVDLVHGIGQLPGLYDLSLSTNGTRLQEFAPKLQTSGVQRLNVSLDTLSPHRFLTLTRRDALHNVLAGLEVARKSGFRLIKINMVWLPEFNGDELDAMIKYCMERNFVLRLIENMPMGDAARQLGSSSLQPLISELRERFHLVDQIVAGAGPARYLATPDQSFSVGFITPMSQHFCEACNRVRVSVTGTLHLCLGQNHRLELLPMLRGGSTDQEIALQIREAVMQKPLSHEFQTNPKKIVRIMASTGG